MRKPRYAALAAAAVVALAGAIPVAAQDGEAPESIKVGAVVPLTGAFAGGGAQVERGYRYAVEAINEAGGVFVEELGTSLPLELLLRDDESDPNRTTSTLEELNGEGVVAYLGGFGSPVHAAGTTIAEKNAVPYLGVATALQALHEQGHRYYFSPFPKSPDIAVSVFEMLNALLPEGGRPTKVGIFAEATDWGEELGAGWEEEAAKHGYEVVFHETYAPGTTDFSDLIFKAQEAGVQALLSLPTPPDGFALFKQMGELGWKPEFSLVVRAADVPTWNDLGAVGDGVFLSAGWHPALGYPGIEPMNQRHIDEEGRPADPVVGGAYSIVQILADAIERAGTLDREAIRDAIAATDLDTVAGHITFREYGTSPITNPLMQRQDGSVQLIWPAEAATAEILYPAN
jgi:branched-chain amino acid transport system substrate-binding protein